MAVGGSRQGRFKIGVGTARPQQFVIKMEIHGDGPSPPLIWLESALSSRRVSVFQLDWFNDVFLRRKANRSNATEISVPV